MTETPEKSAGQSPPELLDGSGIRIGIAVARFNSDITAHFEHVANAASQGLLRTSEDSLKPVIFGVLTTDTVEQAEARIKHASGYADSAVEMVNRLEQLRERRRGIGLY